ncbi:MAG TPA: molecular chaperone DnaJ [Jatrophihabitans sp.]|jgi:molecular chaperone DnaJ|uniref:molecular chaperone DnaJ n=1 Tax=Jatrophihabitans sp. TaxID=1932789 RepID=UPI002E035762|nr:molecular chaperone DnaJ [Jatrophihabitans sp.]
MSTKDYIEKDYYKALGVAKDAPAAEIKKVYRKLARDLHPDKNPGDAKAEARFKEVSEAYGVLSDPAKRKEYDEARTLFAGGGSSGPFSGFPRGSGGAGGNFDMSDLFGSNQSGLGDLFDGLFGAGSGRRSGAAGPQRGKDVNADVTLEFAEAAHGTTLPLRLSSPGTCRTCGGLGSKPGTVPRRCTICSGSGYVSRNQGAFGFSEPCRDCRGTGQFIDDPCPECHGSGASTQTRTITVRIPSGIRDGAKIRVAGKGTPGSQGAPAGDLFVTVHVGPHKLFGRTGDDLTLTVPITFTEAALGTTLRVPTLDGSVALKVAPGTPSGRTLRVRGRGVARKGSTGDLLVTVEVAVPPALDDDARDALEKYAATQHADPRPQITAALAAPVRSDGHA